MKRELKAGCMFTLTLTASIIISYILAILLIVFFTSCTVENDNILIDYTSVQTLTDEENDMLVETITYVKDNTDTDLVYHGILQTYANERVQYWIDNNIRTGNLHDVCLGAQFKYTDNGYFEYIMELANFGITFDLNSFINSPTHNAELLRGDYKYIAVSMKGGYCCLVLSK